jgi:hypothetical protein
MPPDSLHILTPSSEPTHQGSVGARLEASEQIGADRLAALTRNGPDGKKA